MIRNSYNPLTFPFYRFTSVVRFDLSAGVAFEIRTFALPQVQPEEFERFTIACDHLLLKYTRMWSLSGHLVHLWSEI